MKNFPTAILALGLLCGLARAQTPPAQSVLTVVPSDPASAELPHRDRSTGGHWDVSIVKDRLGVAYTFCSDVACLDHKQFTFPALTHDANGRRFLYNGKVIATHDASGTVTIAADVHLATAIDPQPAKGVDVLSARLEFGVP